jgi:hypothetical protein
MSIPKQLDHDLFRILLYGNRATELLLETTSGGLGVPVLPVPAHTRIAEEITAVIKSAWGLETYCMFSLSGGTDSFAPTPCQVVEVCGPGTSALAGMQWVPVASLSAGAFEDSDAFEVIERSLATLDQYRCGELQGTFGKPGWLTVVTDWVRAAATVVGLSLTGKFRQFNASPTFSLIRFETNGPAVWFKATGKPNLHELPITVSLSRFFPGYLPPILGVHPLWNAWLSEEISNTTLEQFTDLFVWERVTEDLAELQIASIGKCCALLDNQCRDLRLSKLIELIPPFLARMAEFMAAQQKQPPPPLTIRELDFLGERLQEAISVLQDFGFPETLGHIDFNPGNILITPARCVFLDWAEACVTHPFTTFEYLAEHLRRSGTADAGGCNRVAAAYLRPWRSFLSPEDLTRTMAVSPLVAVFSYAVAGNAWRSPDALHNSSEAGFLRSLARRMHSEAIRLLDRGVRCSA